MKLTEARALASCVMNEMEYLRKYCEDISIKTTSDHMQVVVIRDYEIFDTLEDVLIEKYGIRYNWMVEAPTVDQWTMHFENPSKKIKRIVTDFIAQLRGSQPIGNSR